MTRAEFLALAAERRGRGHEYIVLVVERPREPRGETVRVWPGVRGRYVGWQGGDRYAVDVRLDTVRP